MTAQEAIKTISHFFIDVSMNARGFTSLKIAEALDMAIDALGKQVPKKPIEATGKGVLKDWRACPSCDMVFGNCDLHKGVSYCPKCGQAIDWSEVEE